MSEPREVRAPRGTELSAKSWQTEAPLRMLMNNLDPEVAERPEDLVVYGGTGRAARSWEAFDAIGGFDERYFMYLEDVDLGDRFTRAGYQNIFCPEAVISHAKGHSTQAHAGAMLRAHHNSAYRFQADRHPAWWQAPLRGALWLGLRVRGLIASASARS